MAPVKTNLSLLGFLALVPIYIGRVQELFTSLLPLNLGKVGVFFAIVCCFVDRSSRTCNIFKLFKIRQLRIFSFLFILSILSIPFSIWIGGSLDAAISFFKLGIFFTLALLVIRTPADISRVIWIFTSTVLIVALAALFGGRAVGERLLTTSTYDTNDLALLIAMALPLVFHLIARTAGARKLILIGSSWLLLVCLANTGSRGGLLAGLTVVASMAARQGGQKFLKFVFLLMLIGSAILPMIKQENFDRLLSIGSVTDDYNISDRGGRLDIWTRTLPLILEHPLGTGIGTFIIAEGGTHDNAGKWSAAHNSFVQIGVELGLPGLILFILLLYQTIRELRAAIVINNNSNKLLIALEASLYGFCVGGMLLSWAYSYVIYFFIALTVSAIRASIPIVTACACRPRLLTTPFHRSQDV